jgi:methylated-DNA-protein-cysteine methyltransferase related protein
MGYFEDIQKKVLKIPRGKVATYGSVARAAGYPGTARQVAWALRASHADRLPWHRVLGSGGRILLHGESGLHQRTLLDLEGVPFRGDRVDIKRCEFLFSHRSSVASRQRGTGRAVIDGKYCRPDGIRTDHKRK